MLYAMLNMFVHLTRIYIYIYVCAWGSGGNSFFFVLANTTITSSSPPLSDPPTHHTSALPTINRNSLGVFIYAIRLKKVHDF